jgi:hypothetical protein
MNETAEPRTNRRLLNGYFWNLFYFFSNLFYRLGQ